jgi:glutathionylspermidine synthase
MRRIELTPRPDWVCLAEEHGFAFHTEGGIKYWDEGHAYVFTLDEIERDLEAPADELSALCYDAVDLVVKDERLLSRVGVPEAFHDFVRASWLRGDKDLYGRFDFRYDGTGPAKLYEVNGDTPTTLYETAAFQWIWLEQLRDRSTLPAAADQFNSIHERLIDAFAKLGIDTRLHLAAISACAEDLGTVKYLRDCAL